MQTKQAFAKSKGVNIAVLDSWIYRHGLPVIQIGRRIYINDDDFEIWLAKHKKIVAEKREQPKEIALPKQCRKSSLAGKIRKIY